jgi:UDP-glucose 4-epimerase
MKLFVTGGAGYIGSVVVESLLQRGDEITVIDNLSTGHREAVPSGVKFIRGDIRDAEALERSLDPSFEAVLHFAAASVVGDSVKDPLLYYDNNVGGAVQLLHTMQKNGITNMIFSSSAAVYGAPAALPIEEGAACAPENPYGHTKLCIENILEACRSAWDLNYVALRYFNAAGSTASHGEDHRPESHLLPLVLDAALGRRESITVFGNDYDTPDGTCIRDYIHVIDLADAHVRALGALRQNFSGALNLGSEQPYSVLDIIRTVEKVTGNRVVHTIGPKRPGDPPALLASSRKAEDVTGWRKRHSDLEEIISSAYEWRLAHPRGYED